MIRLFSYLLVVAFCFNFLGDCLGPLAHQISHFFDQTHVHHDHNHAHFGLGQGQDPLDHQHGAFVSLFLNVFDFNQSQNSGQDPSFLSLKMMTLQGFLPDDIKHIRYSDIHLDQPPKGFTHFLDQPYTDILIPPPKV